MSSEKVLQDLKTILSATEASYALGSTIKLKFVVENHITEEQNFCKYYTPFEGFKGYFLNVYHENGEKVGYQGKLKKRIAPSELDYLTIKDGKSVENVFEIQNNYSIEEAGKYKIQFIGKIFLNGLPDSNILEILVT